jgi:hypothetical protein
MKRWILVIILATAYLIFDAQLYYYGIGFGFTSKKVPIGFRVLFGGTDLCNEGIIIEESQLGGAQLIKEMGSFNINNNESIFITKLLGYYFDEKCIIAKIMTTKDEIKFIKFICKEDPIFQDVVGKVIPQMENENKYKYVNTNHTVEWFKRLQLFKHITTLCFLIVVFIIIRKSLKRPTNPN